ncbi:hypothetical protein VPH35_053728 [Triticum aestivum]
MAPIRPGSPGPALLGTPPTTTSHLTSSTSGGKEVSASRQPNLRTVPVRRQHTGLDLARRNTAHASRRVGVPCPLDGRRDARATPNEHNPHAVCIFDEGGGSTLPRVDRGKREELWRESEHKQPARRARGHDGAEQREILSVEAVRGPEVKSEEVVVRDTA